MSIFTKVAPGGNIIENPIAATRNGDNITIRPHTCLVRLNKGRYEIAPPNSKKVDGQLAVFPGAQVYLNDSGLSVGSVSTNTKDGKTPENNPSKWTAGFWLFITKVSIGGHDGYDVFFGRVGEETTVNMGITGFTVKPPQGPRRYERTVTDALAPVIAELWGHAPEGGSIEFDFDGLPEVVDSLRRLGANSSDLDGLANFRSTINTSKKSMEGRIKNPLARRTQTSQVGEGAKTAKDDIDDTLAALNALGGGKVAV